MVAFNVALWAVCVAAGFTAMALPEDSNEQMAAFWVVVVAFLGGLATLLPAAGA